MHKISIIIPIYNVEKFLPQCLDSVINQTYQNLEIILVNDGSTDSCSQICEEYAARDHRIKVFHQKKGGVSSARNTGLNNVSGSYLGFVDSDDIIDSKFYETLMQILLKNNADIVECEFSTFENEIDVNKKPNAIKSNEVFNTVTGLEMLMKEYLKQVLWNKLYKFDLTEGIMFEVGRINEDDFWSYQVFGNAKKIIKTFNVLYFYRQHEQSIMGKTYNVQRLDGLLALEQRIVYMRKNFPTLENLAIKVFCFGSFAHYQKICEHPDIDPQNKFRNQIKEKVSKYNKLSIYKNWDLKTIFWFQLFIWTPNIYVKCKKYNDRRVAYIKQTKG